MLLTEKYPAADPVNIGHDKDTSIRELLALILRLTGKEVNVVFDTSCPEVYLRRAANVTKLREVTGGSFPASLWKRGLLRRSNGTALTSPPPPGMLQVTVAIR